jgi:hypothetical protein
MSVILSAKKILFRKKITMLKFINKKRTLQWILLLGLLGFAIYTIITQAQLPDEKGTTLLFKEFVHLFAQNDLLGKGIIIVILALQIILLQYYFNKNEYTNKKTLLPVCLYLSILLLTKSLIVISPFLFTLLFFLAIISIEFTVISVKLKNNVFWAGIIIAFATCFDPAGMILLAVAMTTLIINQFSKIKEIAILFTGFLLIYFYFFSIILFTNHFKEWIDTFQQISILNITNLNFLTSYSALISLIVLCILYFYFIFKTRMISESKIVKQRNRIFALNTWSILLVACMFLTSSNYPQALGYMITPVAIYLSILSQEKNPLYINELITVTTLAAFLWL